jgi:hypothetical protein
MYTFLVNYLGKRPAAWLISIWYFVLIVANIFLIYFTNTQNSGVFRYIGW